MAATSNSKTSAPSTAPSSNLIPTSSSISDTAALNTLLTSDTKSLSSPQELTDWVDQMLDGLQVTFGTMVQGVEDRLKEMENRIERLEEGVEGLMAAGSGAAGAGAGSTTGQQSGQGK